MSAFSQWVVTIIDPKVFEGGWWVSSETAVTKVNDVSYLFVLVPIKYGQVQMGLILKALCHVLGLIAC